MVKPRDYLRSDIKKLFAFSGNQCSEPNCGRKIIAEDGDTVVGKICHIEAASTKGPRYREEMTNAERRSYDNLILLCDEHHSIIDNMKNEGKFSKELLLEWKENHEERNFNTRIEVSKQILHQLTHQLEIITLVAQDTELLLKTTSEIKDELSSRGSSPNFLIELKNLVISDIESSPIRSFNDFLDSQYLGYYSRGMFQNKLSNDKKQKFLSENDLIKYITVESFYGLIIHGQGGIGKTRLMLELGNRLLQEFRVIKVLPEFKNFDKLVEFYNLRSNEKFILLFDYIEEQKVFDETITWITNNKFNNIKVIGNCRNSYISEVQNVYSEYFKFIDIGFKSKGSLERQIIQSYQKEVVLSIINSISDVGLVKQLNENNILKSFYEARPSFAAFIKYINLKSPEADMSIATDDTFSKWLIKKFKLTIDSKISYSKFYQEKKYIFKTLACLPASSDAVNEIQKTIVRDISLADEIRKLISDGWVDENNDSLRVVHDTVNDTLLLEFLKHFGFQKFYLDGLLEFSSDKKSISSMLWSIQRVWDDFPEDALSGLKENIGKFISNNFNESFAKEDWFKYKFDNSRLIPELDRINLMIKHKNLLKKTFALEKFGSSLAFSMGWIYQNITNESEKEKYALELKELFFNEWNIDGRFNHFVENARGGKTISCYLNLLGMDQFIENRFDTYLEKVNINIYNLEPFSLAIVSWFNQDGRVNNKIENLIKQWFQVYRDEQPENVNPTYLVKACLSKELDFDITFTYIEPNTTNLNLVSQNIILELRVKEDISVDLRNMVVDWFKIYENEELNLINPLQLILSWLENGNDISIVRKVIKQNLSNPHCDIDIKARLISKWLEKSEETEFIEPFLNILNEEIYYKSAYSIIGFWLQKSDNPLIIKPFLKNWLNDHPSEPKILSFIFHYWLSKGDEPNLLIGPIRNCMDILVDQDTLGNIFADFIHSGGNIIEFKSEIIDWLNYNSNSSYSVTVLGYLLEKTTDSNILVDLESVAIKVFKNFAELREIGFSIGYWIEKSGNLSIVQPYIKPWLNLFGISRQGSVIAGLWLQRGGNIKEVKEFIIPCLNELEATKGDSILMLNWLLHGDDPYLIRDFVKRFFEIKENKEASSSKYLIPRWLEKTDEPLLVRDAVRQWLAANENDATGSINLCTFWLIHVGEAELVSDYILDQFQNHSSLKQSVFVIKSWVYINGDPELIRPSIINYLENNWTEIQAISAIKQLIEARDYIEVITFYILKIANKLGYNPFANLIKIRGTQILLNNISMVRSSLIKTKKESTKLSIKIKEHLKNGYSPDLIKKDVVEYLTKNGDEDFASYVIAAWTEYGNDFELISEFLIGWLEGNLRESFHSSFVIAAALENQKAFSTVHDKAIEWLDCFGKSYNAKFLLSSWLKLKGNQGALEIEQWITYYVENLYDPNKHNWRDELLLDFCREKCIE